MRSSTTWQTAKGCAPSVAGATFQTHSHEFLYCLLRVRKTTSFSYPFTVSRLLQIISDPKPFSEFFSIQEIFRVVVYYLIIKVLCCVATVSRDSFNIISQVPYIVNNFFNFFIFFLSYYLNMDYNYISGKHFFPFPI